MFQLTQDVYELAACETAKQQTIVVAISHGQRREPITSTLAVIWTRAADEPAIPVAAPLERNSNLICAHRATPYANQAIVAAIA